MATALWVWQDGTPEEESFQGSAMGPNGSCVLAGVTQGSWDGTIAGGDDAVAVKLDAEGNELWRYQIGTGDALDDFYGIAVQQDGSVILAGDIDDDFYVTKLDAEGVVEWSFQVVTTANDYAQGMAMAEDGSVICVGVTDGSWDGNANNGENDFAAFRLDGNGEEIWRYQNGTEQHDSMRNVAMVDGEMSVVVVGATEGDFGGASNGGVDVVVVKLDATSGTEVWRYQAGSSAEDIFTGIAVAEDNSIVVSGYTDGSWVGGNAGIVDFVAVKLSSEGEELWRWQDGTVEVDFLCGVAIQADGSILLAGTTEGDWDGANAGGRDFIMVALSSDGEELWRWQDGTTGSETCVTLAGSEGRVILAGNTDGSWGETNAVDDFDFVAVMLDVPTSATPAPSPILNATPAPSIAPSASSPSPPALGATSPAPTSIPPALGATSPAPTNVPSDNIPSAVNFAAPSTSPASMALAAALLFFMPFVSRIVR